MKPLEIVESIKASNPNALGKMKDNVAAKVIQLAMAELAKQLNETEEGVVRVGGLGNFKVTKVTREQDGKPVAVKRIVLRPKADAVEATKA